MNFEKKSSSSATNETEHSLKKSEKSNIDRIITEKGSEYVFLPDGRTQRFKKAEDKQYEPQDAIVFVPDFEWVKKMLQKKH